MSKRTISSKIFCKWVGLANKFYYPHSYYHGMERIPADGNAIVMVGNHQNCMMDPVNVEVALKDRKPYCLVRGDIFRVNKGFTKFLYWLGLLPVNRFNFEGLQGSGSAKEANKKTFAEATKWMAEGNTLILFPEAGHQNKRWLGYFSLGYLTLAFETAAATEWKKEVYIMPFGHHYGNYFHARHDFVLRYGTPIALSPYYEQYQSKPRTTMRETNTLVEQQIGSLMLNIRDLEHYEAIDALRESPEGRAYAKQLGYNPQRLDEKQESDKQLVKELEAPERKEALDKLEQIEQKAKSLGTRDWVLARQPNGWNLALRLIALTVGAPLMAAASAIVWPTLYGPRIMFNKKINGAVDDMFRSTWNFGFAVLITLPVCWLLAAIIPTCIFGWIGLTWLAAYPLAIWYGVEYMALWRKSRGVWNYATKREARLLAEKRNQIVKELNIIK